MKWRKSALEWPITPVGVGRCCRTMVKSLYLTKHHTMKTCWRSGGISPRIFNLGAIWSWVVSFTPPPLYPGVKPSGTHWIGGWVGSRAGHCRCWELNAGLLTRSLVCMLMKTFWMIHWTALMLLTPQKFSESQYWTFQDISIKKH
jgi:hypothetical protein